MRRRSSRPSPRSSTQRKTVPDQARDTPSISAVYVDTWRDTYRGIGPGDYLAGLSYEESEHLWLGRLTSGASGVFVAEDDRGIFGFACGRPRKEFSKGLEECTGASSRRSTSCPMAKKVARGGRSWPRSPGTWSDAASAPDCSLFRGEPYSTRHLRVAREYRPGARGLRARGSLGP
jgi:hypothetical protein